MTGSGTICIFSEDTDLLYEQAVRLNDRNYLAFATSNIYKFVKYARELHPDLIVVDMDASAMNDVRVHAYLHRYRSLTNKPILMLGRKLEQCYRGIAHYVTKPYALQFFDEIVESYCDGNKQHDVLLIDDCNSRDDKILDAIRQQNLSCFEVNDTDAARYYLLKNHPRCICLNLPYEQCTKVEPKIHHDKIFFVDNYKQVRNLARLI